MSALKSVLALFVVLFSICQNIIAKSIKDTLYTSAGDRVILVYDISASNNRCDICFRKPIISLGASSQEQFKNPEMVAVMFFDRTGGYDSGVSFKGIVPEAFKIPPYVDYRLSSEGFFVLQEEPALSFSVKKDSEICVPVYLAYHTRKGKYSIFSCCKESLTIRLQVLKEAIKSTKDVVVQQQETSTTIVMEADNTEEIKVLESIKYAIDLLNEANRLPFSDSLEDEIRFLRTKKRELTDSGLLSKIASVLELYDEKKIELEEKRLAEDKEAKEMEAIAIQEAEKLKAKKDSTMIESQKAEIARAEKAQKKRLLIAIVSVALAFVGNQVFQGIRTARNQRKMMNYQQSIVDKAEAAAKRRARNAARGKANQAVYQYKKKMEDAARKKTATIKNNRKSKKMSI